jgi:hypothetical protein
LLLNQLLPLLVTLPMILLLLPPPPPLLLLLLLLLLPSLLLLLLGIADTSTDNPGVHDSMLQPLLPLLPPLLPMSHSLAKRSLIKSEGTAASQFTVHLCGVGWGAGEGGGG